MGSPTDVADVGLTSTVFGGLTKGMGDAFGGVAGFGQNQYQAGVAEINAQVAKQNEEYAIQQGELQAQEEGIKGGQEMGHIKAAQAGSGLDVLGGSAVAFRQSQQQIINMDLNTIRSNASKTAYDYDVQSAQFENQAKLYQRASVDSLVSGALNVTSTVLGTSASVASKWLTGQNLGMWGGVNSSNLSPD